MPTTDHAAMKLMNQLAVLRSIRDEGPISRVEIKDRTRLSWGTVTATTRELLDQGIISEIGSIATGVGRRPVELDLNRTANFVLGLQLGGRVTRAVLTDVKGTVIDDAEAPVNSRGTTQEMLASLQDIGRRLLRRHDVSRSLLAGVGIAAPGAVDFSTGVCLYAPHHPHLRDVPMKQSFERAFGVPCFVDHGYNCFVLAEQVFGYGRGLRSFIGVLLGTGMSAGFVINGEVYRGADSLAGEFGHTCIDERGPLCACGNRGCLEALASGSAIAAAARKARDGADGHDPTAAVDADSDDGARAITAETVAAAARAGDAASREIYARMGSVLGVGISNLISTFNPEAIILGGRVSKAADLFLPSCMEVVRRRAWHASTKQVKVSQLERGQALGAAALVLQQLFTSGLILRRGADPAAPRKRSSPSSKPSSKARARGA